MISQGGEVSDIYFRNNIFITGAGTDVLKPGDGFYFHGNCYWCMDGTFRVGDFTDFKSWIQATGHEQIDGQSVGLFANPLLRNPGNGEKITDPLKLKQLYA